MRFENCTIRDKLIDVLHPERTRPKTDVRSSRFHSRVTQGREREKGPFIRGCGRHVLLVAINWNADRSCHRSTADTYITSFQEHINKHCGVKASVLEGGFKVKANSQGVKLYFVDSKDLGP